MRLFRYYQEDKVKPGIHALNKHYDVSSFGEDFDGDFFASDGLKRIKTWFEKNANRCKLLDKNLRFAACVERPSKIVCIGLNYVGHAKETNSTIPKEPVIFMKAPSALCGCSDDIIIPPEATKTDYEVELACVIGKRAAYISADEALSYLAGFTIMNDYSERAFQKERGGQWVKGKSADTFAPVGPYLVPTAEVANYQSLNLWLKVNGELRQDSNTEDMIFKVPFLISYVSQFMTLMPGDILSTGTPEGVGLGRTPPLYLSAKDVVEYGIDELGQTKQKLVAYDNA